MDHKELKSLKIDDEFICKLLPLCEEVIEYDGGTTYSSEDDSVGYKVCCGEYSYREHKSSCYILKMKLLLKSIGMHITM